MAESILYTVEDGIAIIRLNRADAHNALNLEMRTRLQEILDEIDRNNEVRAVTLFGEGRSFCAGQDLKEGSAHKTPVDYLLTKEEIDFQDRLTNLKRPTLVGLHGNVMGRGLMVALACDIRIAASGARFSVPEVKIGMLPGFGGTQRLARLVGPARAMHLAITGDPIDTETALLWGLVTAVVPVEELRTKVMAVARSIADNAPLAVRYARQAVRQAPDLPLEEGLRMEAALGAVLASTEDKAEGVLAFKERRKPNFKGR